MPAPEPVPNFCLLTDPVSITQVQYDILDEHAQHVLVYLIEQRETRAAECPPPQP